MAEDLDVTYSGAGGIAIRVRIPWPKERLCDSESTDVYKPSEEAIQRAAEAICSALPEDVSVYLDGLDKEPTQVIFDPWDVNSDNDYDWDIE